MFYVALFLLFNLRFNWNYIKKYKRVSLSIYCLLLSALADIQGYYDILITINIIKYKNLCLGEISNQHTTNIQKLF